MAPATKRKNEEGDTLESKHKATSNTKPKHKPAIISSIQFDRSFKLLEKKYLNNGSKTVAPRLDIARHNKNDKTPSSNTDQAANTSTASDNSQVLTEDMEGDWEILKTSQKPSQEPAHVKPMEQSNKYETLSHHTHTDEAEQANENNCTNKKAAQKPPPITVHNSFIKNIIQLLRKNELSKEPIRLRQISGLENTINIQANSIENYSKTLPALKIENAEFYTYTPKGAKVKSIILKGVKGDFSEEDVKEELSNKNFNNETSTPDMQIMVMSATTPEASPKRTGKQ
ncbi:hypothetical protein PV325_006895 [Microctonus aethiopoides]|nr:hypothetical protein PV325_006895 [Microctonus aethiopoides]